MKLQQMRVRNFRNIKGTELTFAAPRIFLLGPNGQGKTNLLEAIGYVSALRAFRPGDNRTLIEEGQVEAALGFQFEHEKLGAAEVLVRIRARSKEVWLDGTPVRRLAEVIGRFPTVLFASDDIQLVRGGPALRRRFLDLHLASLESGYFVDLQAYHRALDARNRLLKAAAGQSELAAFERELAAAACRLVARRRAGAARLAEFTRSLHAGLAAGGAAAEVIYVPDFDGEDEGAYLEQWERERKRDLQVRFTQRGPHRDDLELRVGGREAALYASEGQQRALVLALRFAQLRDVRARSGHLPLVLADDVLGELDPERRVRFWEALDGDVQLFATGTTPPEDQRTAWDIVKVEGGVFRRGN